MEAAAAVVAVSEGMRADVLAAYPAVREERVHVIQQRHRHGRVRPRPGDRRAGGSTGLILGRPSVIFVGRITRQKGVPVLLRAAAGLDPAAQLILCAGQPDTPELAAEVERPGGGPARRRAPG